MELVVRGPASKPMGRGRLKWSVLDAAGEGGREKVIRPSGRTKYSASPFGGLGRKRGCLSGEGRPPRRAACGGGGVRPQRPAVLSLDLRSGKITR